MLLGIPAVAAEPEAESTESKIDISGMIFGHIGDSYEWHFTNIGETPIAIPLPVILYSKERGEWFTFSSSKVEEEEYQGFYIAEEGDYAGKIVERNASGEEVRPVDISLTKNAVALILNCIILTCIILSCARWYKGKEASTDSPKGFIGLMEMMISMVYNDIVKANIPVHVQRYAPYLLTAFFFIFLNNLIGLIPGSANITGNIAVTCVLAFCTFLMVNLFGNKEYWKEIFWADVPGPLKPITTTFLDEQAYNMDSFILAYMQQVKKASDSEKMKVARTFIDASLNNPMFNDPDKETTQAYIEEKGSIAPFSIDTDWIKALQQIQTK